MMGQGHPGRPNPSLTRTMLGQLCTPSWVSRPAAGYDTAWDQTRVCSDASSSVMQCLRPLYHSGGPYLKKN